MAPLYPVTETVDEAADRVTLRGRCTISREPYEVTVRLSGYREWQRGALIQRALPECNADVRELLISGSTPEAFNNFFNDA